MASETKTREVDVRKIKPTNQNQLVFGRLFTDHMLEIDWTKDGGWKAPTIVPYGPIQMATSATALHYGISVHEGISIVENAQTRKMQAFRARDSLKAFYDSSAHLDMPLFDTEQLHECIKKLVILDRDWIDVVDNTEDQFYARMVHFSTDSTLGVRPPQSTKMLVMLNPVMLKSKPISLKCSYNVNKNWPLGHGQHRLSGNLGPLIPSVTDAKMNGFDDVLWLLDDYIKEMTVLNVFMLQQSRFGNLELLTPPDDGCILNGITRQTILDMSDKIKNTLGCDVKEREISIHELINSDKEDRLISMFGASTHCPLMSINRLCYRDTTVMLDKPQGRKMNDALNTMIVEEM